MLMRPRRLLQLALLLVASFSPPLRAADAAPTTGRDSTFTADGAWCWFSDPRALYRDGRIFAGWVSTDGSVQVGALSTATGAVEIATLAPRFEVDDHNNPALLFLPDGRLAAFYSLHARGDMRLRITTRPGDLGEWTAERSLGFHTGGGRGVTYANPVLLREEKNALYLFWRGADYKPTFSVSRDLGETWEKPRTLLLRPDAGHDNRPYLKVWSDGLKRISFAFTDGHPRNEPTNSLHYFRYENGVFSTVNGTRLGTLADLPLDPARADRVYDGASAGRAWVWDIAERRGRPFIAYTRHPAETDHRYHYAFWDGKAWQDSAIADAGSWFPQTPAGKKESEPHYSAGLALDHRHPDTVYVSLPVDGRREIIKARTPDSGLTWIKEPVTVGSTADNVRPFVVRGAPPGEPFLLWMHLDGRYVHYTNYRTSLRLNQAPSPQNPTPLSPALEPRAIMEVLRRVGDHHLTIDWRVRPDDWVAAVGHTGLFALAETSGDPRYFDALRTIGETNQWNLGPSPYFADDHCIGQVFADLYLRERDPRMIAPMRERFDSIMAAPKDTNLDVTRPGAFSKWSWCDALFMAPPAWLRLTIATGDPRYLEFAVKHWWITSDYLYDTEEHLYFRDSTFFKPREANGQKIFWSRGNGWVMGGLVRMLQFLPADHPSRPRFVTQFQEMSARLLSIQQADGLWRSSLLDPASYPARESSGTGLITYGLAWGVNHGLLDRATYAPAITRAWTSLVGCVEPDGRLTQVQPVGLAPVRFPDRSTDAFGVGAFLLAGSEVHRLAATP